MLAASIRREVHLGNMLSARMQSRVPRCLFGPPNPKDTVELLQEALDMERSKFISRWGVDPRDEDKENFQIVKCEGRSPRKSRSAPYNRQTSIHDYWRARKMCDVNPKKSLVSASDMSKKPQDLQKPQN
ncbi:uncharacterized protein LOC107039564 [Diachasma alloeum]|uniref:uncharacterized protein LOC107039564 n=1 Tax=Diachasma alloeum TaxID=454923 RepID=UPI0007381D61|nr:uncharacterized protein LOC107039564 [Diachasma alloeum]